MAYSEAIDRVTLVTSIACIFIVLSVSPPGVSLYTIVLNLKVRDFFTLHLCQNIGHLIDA